MHGSVIPLRPARVAAARAADRAAFAARVAELTRWLTTEATEEPLHRVTSALFERLTALALAALTLWSALRLDEDVPPVLVHSGASYTFGGWRREPVRTRFGVFHSCEPVYRRHKGRGPRRLFPHARPMGLAAGRMSLGVHLMVANLAARMPFAAVRQVADTVGLWVPGPRAMLGIVDRVGAAAVATMWAPAAPAAETEGTHVVIEQDDGGIPHVSPGELTKRRRPNRRRTRGRRTRREQRRQRRGRRAERTRRRTGDKSKNCRMATVYVVYTLQVHDDGTVEGPLNRQVFAATRDKKNLRQTVLRAAKARGWGTKPSVYLADGASCHWTAWKRTFSAGTPCVDWYHVAEYLWSAAEAVYRTTRTAPKGQRARKAFNQEKQKVARARSAWVRSRQDELLAGDIEAVERALQALPERIGRTGPGTRGRRDKVTSALTYIQNHSAFLTYAKIGHIVMGTGIVEGTIKQLGARLKGPGMRWSVERAEHVLALRCLQLADEGAWQRFTNRVCEAHEATTSLRVPSISPTHAVTPHKAARKAA